jgi:hypothetical protein
MKLNPKTFNKTGYTLLYAAVFYFILFIFASFFMGNSEKIEQINNETVNGKFSINDEEKQPLLESNI